MEDKKIISFEDIFPDDLLKLKLDKDKLRVEFPELLIKFNKKNDGSNEIRLFDEIFDDHFNSKYNSKANILKNKLKVLLDNISNETNREKIGTIKKEISNINEMQNSLLNEFRIKLKFTDNYADRIYKKENSIIINIENNQKQVITNTSLINFHGTVYDSHSVYIVGNYYLLIHIVTANDQASSLGIWDTRLNNWCFTHSDEGFFLREFKYNEFNDTFRISSSNFAYDKEYLINEKKVLIEL